ncbi:MAG TPA: hypothetical protein VGM58_08640 [Verrucomicrobiae bacterium]
MILFLAAQPSFSAPGVGDKLPISVTNKFGDVFTNLTVAQILGDGLVLENASGQLKVKYENLPPAIREKYQPLSAGIVEKEQKEGALTAAYFAHTEELQAEQSQLQAAREAKELADDIASGKEVQCLRIAVPNQDWAITMMNPGLKALDRQVDGDLLSVRGLPGTNGFNLSLFVQPAADNGTNHMDAFNYYWSPTANSSLVDASSVRVEKKEKFVIVAYTVQGQPNANYYFAYKGRWVDVHISKWPFDAEADGKLFAKFEEYLSYGE